MAYCVNTWRQHHIEQVIQSTQKAKIAKRLNRVLLNGKPSF